MNCCDDDNDGADETVSRFFNPWIGDNYWGGIGRHKFSVLVLGASVYCTYDGNHTYKGKKKERCPYFEECTSEYTKDSSPFNNLCPHPEWDSNGEATPLEDYPIYVSSGTTARFGNIMKSRFGEILNGDSIWDHIAFTEYVQYFLDHENTFSDDLSDRDLDAFMETIDELIPDIVIVWGNVVANVLRESQYAIDADDDEPWDFAWKYDNMFIRFICCTHPASGNFSYNFPEFANRFEEIINISEDSDNDEDDEEEDCNDDEGYDEDEDEDGDEDEDEDGDEDDDNNDSGNGIGDNLTLRLLLSNAIKDL